MPNWATSRVTLSGNLSTIKEIQNKLATPYPSPHNPIDLITGEFLLWNIVKPNNLSAYLGEEQKAFAEIIKADPELAELNNLEIPNNSIMPDLMAKIHHDMETGEGWYEWNCRNWGTKWDIGQKAYVFYEMPRLLTQDDPINDPDEPELEVCYQMESAWSPPVEALDKLAEQYPTIQIDLISIDEGDCFACEVQWLDGNRFYEQDLEITHAFGMEFRGYCNLRCCNDYE